MTIKNLFTEMLDKAAVKLNTYKILNFSHKANVT